MRDNQIYQLIIPIFLAGFANRGLSDILVLQKYQPRQEGVPSARSMYLFKIADQRYGFARRDTVATGVGNSATTTVDQMLYSTFQASTLAPQNPADINSLTGSDIAQISADILQSPGAFSVLKQYGVGLLRILQVVNPYFLDDRDRQESSASFDFVLAHNTVDVTLDPEGILMDIELVLERI